MVCWLPNGTCSGRILSGFVIDLDKARKRLRPKKLEPPAIVKRLAQAEEWQRQIDTGGIKHRAEISNREGISRARVTQLMHLLKLHPEIRTFIHGLGSDVPRRYVTARRLRPLCSLRLEEQLSEVLRIMSAGAEAMTLVGFDTTRAHPPRKRRIRHQIWCSNRAVCQRPRRPGAARCRRV